MQQFTRELQCFANSLSMRITVRVMAEALGITSGESGPKKTRQRKLECYLITLGCVVTNRFNNIRILKSTAVTNVPCCFVPEDMFLAPSCTSNLRHRFIYFSLKANHLEYSDHTGTFPDFKKKKKAINTTKRI